MYSLLRKKELGIFTSAAAVCSIALLSLHPTTALARGNAEFIELSLEGSYSTKNYDDYSSEHQVISGQIALPFNNTMGVSFGHSARSDKNMYKDSYREALAKQGVNLPEGPIEQIRNEINNYINATVSQRILNLRATLQAGAFWRKYCAEDTFRDYGCNEQDVTWNMKLDLAAYMGMRTNFKVSYQISPSEYQGTAEKNLDKVWTTGLSWSL
jgi:hypothetical protein